jgi:hypothetical protein
MNHKMKQQIITEIRETLSALGLPAHDGNDTDIIVNAEFLDAKWSTGSKKISYEAAIFADEREEIVYMFEKTTESDQGLSFGMSGGSSFQSGSTLYRKVKSIQYGPDGKAYEYELDFGAIPKAVKEIALRCGWKFKTVIRRKKASYPAID